MVPPVVMMSSFEIIRVVYRVRSQLKQHYE
jgi:hypothetical protein